MNVTMMLETLTSMRRAGADVILTYFAKEAVLALGGREVRSVLLSIEADKLCLNGLYRERCNEL